MRNLIHYRQAIQSCKTRLELSTAIDEVCADTMYQYDVSDSYKGNAEKASMQSKPGVSELLMLAHNQERKL